MLAYERDRAPVISLTQIHTFLVLVEEGSVTRASGRLGLCHSTISAHAKLIAEELGQLHFNRFQGGLIPTPAGLEAYNRFRALAARAAFAIRYFRCRAGQPPAYVPVTMPAGFPGSLLDQATSLAAGDLATAAPEVCLLPSYGAGPPDIPSLAVEFGSDPDARGAIRDRWIVIRSGSAAGWRSRPLPLAGLAGMGIHVPALPPVLHAGLSALAEEARAVLKWSSAGLQEILARAAPQQNFCVIVPASLLNPSIDGAQFDCAPVEETPFDPILLLRPGHFPGIASRLGARLQVLLAPDSLARLAKTVCPAPEPESLSLKHCRSFLALYEEGNVRRAAQRLSIVQPALTVQLHRIEEQAGCPLFTRSHYGLKANEAADALSDLLHPLVAEFNAITRALRAPPKSVAMPVRVGLIPALDDESVTAKGFAAALYKWSETYGDHVVRVVEGYSGTLVRWLNSGKIDFALIDRVFTDSTLIFDTIGEDAMAVVTNGASGLLWPGPVSLEALMKLPLVLPSNRHGLRTLLTQMVGERGVTLQPRIEVDSMAACLSLVKIARYATILPIGAVYNSRDRRGLTVHEIKEPRIVRKICLVRSRNEPCGQAALNFIDELRSAFTAPGAFPAGTLETAPAA